MKNLTKHLLLLIAIFSIILISSFSIGKASAQQKGTCSLASGGWKCSLPGFENKRYSEPSCKAECIIAAPTPIPSPTPVYTCETNGGQCTSVGVACNSLGSYVWGGYKSTFCPDSSPQCCVPASAPTPTPTTPPIARLVWQPIALCPAPTLTLDQCVSHCGARAACVQCPSGNFVCNTTNINECPKDTPAFTSTPAPTSAPTDTPTLPPGVTPTSTPTPKPLLSITNVTTKLLGNGYVEATATLNKDYFSCLSMECSYKDGNSSTPVVASTVCMYTSTRPANAVVNSNFKPTQSNQWSLLSCKINTIPPSSKPLATYTNTSSLDTLTLTPTPSPAQAAQRGSPTPTPTQPPAGPAATTPNLFNCLDDQTGNYQCDTIIEGVMKCRSGYEDYSPPAPYTGTSCGERRGCCKKKPSVSAPTITPTSAPVNNVTLYLTLNAQDIPVSPDPLPVSLVLYNLTTNDPVTTGAPPSKSFARTPIPGKHYSANIPLTNLASDKYFIVARRDNMIAKSLFTVTGETGNITVPTTTLVFGDINKDNDIDALDYHLLRPCYKKTISSTPDCAPSDFDKNGIIDQIDLNTLLRGWATWNKEGKEIQ